MNLDAEAVATRNVAAACGAVALNVRTTRENMFVESVLEEEIDEF
jgi:hypothetical protein